MTIDDLYRMFLEERTARLASELRVEQLLASRNLDVERVSIRDKDGKLRGSLGLDAGGGVGLFLNDDNGVDRILASISANGDPRIRLVAPLKGSANILIEDSTEGGCDTRFRFWAGTATDGPSFVRIIGANGIERAEVRIHPRRGPDISLTEYTGTERAAICLEGMALADHFGRVAWATPTGGDDFDNYAYNGAD